MQTEKQNQKKSHFQSFPMNQNGTLFTAYRFSQNQESTAIWSK